jgi:hypothetical protein
MELPDQIVSVRARDAHDFTQATLLQADPQLPEHHDQADRE